MLRSLLSVLWLAACAPEAVPAPEPAAVEPSDCPDGTWVTWDNFAQPFLTTWCTPCHSSALVDDQREGAPEGVNFDTYADAVAWGDVIATMTDPADPQMPPAGGPTDDERALLAEWIRCDAPSPPAPTVPGPCDALTWVDGSSPPCGRGNAVTGDLVVADDEDLSCLCAVDGSLVLSGGSWSAPLLSSVGGDLSATGCAGLDVPALASVGGDLEVTGCPDVSALDFQWLATVGGDFALSDDAALSSVDLPRLASVGGRFELSDLPVLTDILNAHALVSTGGDVTLTGLDAVPLLDLFARLETVGGNVTISGDPVLASLEGFDNLKDVGGAVSVVDLPAVTSLSAFADLESVGGPFEVARVPLLAEQGAMPNLAATGGLIYEDLPLLPKIWGYDALAVVHGDVRIARLGGLTEMAPLPALIQVDGGFDLEDVPALVTAKGFAIIQVDGDFTLDRSGLAAPTGFTALNRVGGTLAVDENLQLQTAFGLQNLDSVGGDLVVTGNLALPDAEVAALIASIGRQDIGGEVIASGNGG